MNTDQKYFKNLSERKSHSLSKIPITYPRYNGYRKEAEILTLYLSTQAFSTQNFFESESESGFNKWTELAHVGYVTLELHRQVY